MDWLSAIARAPASAFPLARVVVASVRGSAPRDAGTCMLVSARGQIGTIGGGQLEWQAASEARALLNVLPAKACVKRWTLGTELGQCCGGAVELWIERIDESDQVLFTTAQSASAKEAFIALESMVDASGRMTRRLLNAGAGEAIEIRHAAEGARVLLERIGGGTTPLWLFGAGHVGRSLVKVLGELPFEVTWIDPRADAFPDEVPANASMRSPLDPVDEVAHAPERAAFLVMTHSHELDYRLCAAVLRRGRFAWFGLIGSETKATCFRLRLARDASCADRVHRLVSPIGLPGVKGKQPGIIAVSVAAQLLQWRSEQDSVPSDAAAWSGEPA